MKLIFENSSISYDGFDSFTPVLVGNRWQGLAEVDDKLGEKLVKLPGVTEASDSDWEYYKKKLNEEAVAYRTFGTVQQDPAKNPNANYVEEAGSQAPSNTSDKEIIEVEVEDVDPPKEEEPEPAPKPKKGKK